MSEQTEQALTRDRPGSFYSEDEVRLVRVRGKARTLTKLCVACENLGGCAFGRRLEQFHKEFCRPQVGDDFRRCARCSRTLDGSCVVDQAALADELHQQLAVCTQRRGFDMPLNIARLDVLFGSGDSASRNFSGIWPVATADDLVGT
jgi:hypothetical protein